MSHDDALPRENVPGVYANFEAAALEHGRAGRSCSEAIMLSYGPSLGLDSPTAIKLASGFGGGLGQCGEVCGALCAACMIIGLRFGTDRVDDVYGRKKTYLLVQELIEGFKAEMGAVQCRDLCFARLAPNQGLAQVRRLDLPERCVSLAARVLNNLLRDNQAL